MNIQLRLEEKNDQKEVEILTREAFWNLYFPGCNEHLLAHNLRKTKEFIKELNFVALDGNKIVGNIMYAETMIKSKNQEHKTITFGPLSVLPEYQNKGIGTKLLEHTKALATKLGYKAIIIYGDPTYYKKFGFVESKKYNITNSELKYPAALLILELHKNALNGIEGIFDTGNTYHIDEKELEKFETQFSKKEKLTTESQTKFLEMVTKYL